MTGTAKQPKVSMTHGTASQKAGTTIYIDNMSQTPDSLQDHATSQNQNQNQYLTQY